MVREVGTASPCKVGISVDPFARLAVIQSGYWRDVELVYVAFVGDAARDVEELAHGALTDAKCRGEWFWVDADHAISAIKGACSELGTGLRSYRLDSDG